jgi:hypothetical protein
MIFPRKIDQLHPPDCPRLGQPCGRADSGSGQRFTSKGERCSRQVSALDAAAKAQNRKKPIE